MAPHVLNKYCFPAFLSFVCACVHMWNPEHFISPVNTPTGYLYLRASHNNITRRSKKTINSLMFLNAMYFKSPQLLWLAPVCEAVSHSALGLFVGERTPLSHCRVLGLQKYTIYPVPISSQVSLYSCSGHCGSQTKPYTLHLIDRALLIL